MSALPDDFDAETIRLLIAHGVDVTKEREIEFVIEVESGDAADWAVAILSSYGFRCVVDTLPDGKTIEVVANLSMVPSYDNVVQIQAKIAQLLSGRQLVVAGWGTLIG